MFQPPQRCTNATGGVTGCTNALEVGALGWSQHQLRYVPEDLREQIDIIEANGF